jgi:hypothetical protein
MVPIKDYYQTLQVHPEAEAEVIQAAYRKLAAKYHPDINKAPDAGERMAQINIAYEVLSDPQRRFEYDARNNLRRPRARTSGAKGGRVIWSNLVFIALIAISLSVLPRFGFSLLPTLIRFGGPLIILGIIIWVVYNISKLGK